jgi:hypothetical protein
VSFNVKPSAANRNNCSKEHRLLALAQQKRRSQETRSCANLNCTVSFSVHHASPQRYHNRSCAALVNNKIRPTELRINQGITLRASLEASGRLKRYKRTTITKSIITGQYYNGKIHKQSWHHQCKLFSATRLSKMFEFELGQPFRTLPKILAAIEQLTYMYEVEKLSGNEIAESFNIYGENTHFSQWLGTLGVKIRNIKDSQNVYWKRNLKPLDNKWLEYRKSAKFRFKNNEFHRLVGYDTYQLNGWFNPYTNPDGCVRDHMFSCKEGYLQNIPPELIAHPANCELLSHKNNAKKSSKCSITLEWLYNRIADWSISYTSIICFA